MKNILIFLPICFLLLSCKKDTVPEPIDTIYYESEGNLLILMVGDTFEKAYEYNLASTQLSNDSLLITYETVPAPMDSYYYWNFLPNPDTLFWSLALNYTFMAEGINNTNFKKLNSPIPYDSSKVQVIFHQGNSDYEEIWSKVSKLEIVKTYRNALPNSRIGIMRTVMGIYNEELGFAIPEEKHLLFLVK